MRNLLLLFILLAGLKSFGQEWPSEEFILKFKYEEIVGEILTTKEQIETFERPMYPRGKAGIKKNDFQGNPLPSKQGETRK